MSDNTNDDTPDLESSDSTHTVDPASHNSSTWKVLGEIEAPTGAGVLGHNTATSGTAAGIEGATDSPDGYGLYTADDARVEGTMNVPVIQSAAGNALTVNTDGGSRALELGVPTSDGSNIAGGNFVAGHPTNTVNNSAVGVVIAGGGVDGLPNSVGADYATVGGGFNNTATGENATVGGGDSNTASGAEATVCGGLRNNASGGGATVAGGDQNEATGITATVGGGFNNTASGFNSAIPGGDNNTASGNYSFAAGRDAETETSGGNPFPGTFVWGDSSSRTVRAGEADQFVVQAEDGVYIDGSTADPAGPGGSIAANNNLIETSTGAVLTDTGTWQDNSSRAAKEGIEPIDETNLLNRVENLPISEWSYEDDDARHVGPMAEDFHEVFGLGSDNDRLASLDTAGVALAAIQGLSGKLDEEAERFEALEAENEHLRERNDELESRLEALEDHLGFEDAGGLLEPADD